MHWDDRIFTGMHGKWSWLVVRELIRELSGLVTEYHAGQRLCITAFDSGPITPSPEERRIGWTLLGDVMVSPPLTPQLQIPCDEYDEWYVFQFLPTSINVTDRYVNYCGFNLANPYELTASQDPTWDRTNYGWLVPLQRQFWSDIERLNPTSYISSGDVDVVVSRDPAFVQRMHDAAREILE
jgi:hypothetical protein